MDSFRDRGVSRSRNGPTPISFSWNVMRKNATEIPALLRCTVPTHQCCAWLFIGCRAEFSSLGRHACRTCLNGTGNAAQTMLHVVCFHAAVAHGCPNGSPFVWKGSPAPFPCATGSPMIALKLIYGDLSCRSLRFATHGLLNTRNSTTRKHPSHDRSTPEDAPPISLAAQMACM